MRSLQAAAEIPNLPRFGGWHLLPFGFFAVWAHGDSWYELLTREEPATAVGKAAKKLVYQEVASSRPRNNGPDAVGFACCPGTYSPEDKTL